MDPEINNLKDLKDKYQNKYYNLLTDMINIYNKSEDDNEEIIINFTPEKSNNGGYKKYKNNFYIDYNNTDSSYNFNNKYTNYNGSNYFNNYINKENIYDKSYYLSDETYQRNLKILEDRVNNKSDKNDYNDLNSINNNYILNTTNNNNFYKNLKNEKNNNINDNICNSINFNNKKINKFTKDIYKKKDSINNNNFNKSILTQSNINNINNNDNLKINHNISNLNQHKEDINNGVNIENSAYISENISSNKLSNNENLFIDKKNKITIQLKNEKNNLINYDYELYLSSPFILISDLESFLIEKKYIPNNNSVSFIYNKKIYTKENEKIIFNKKNVIENDIEILFYFKKDFYPLPSNKFNFEPSFDKLSLMDYNELCNINNFTIYNDFGKIIFLQPIDITYMDFDNYITIENNIVEIKKQNKNFVGKKVNIIINFNQYNEFIENILKNNGAYDINYYKNEKKLEYKVVCD